MKKNLSYRDKLLELANIYRIVEIKNYIKNKKKLTTPQIIHILKKNKVPIPTEINKSIIEIHSKKFTKPFSDFNEFSTYQLKLIVKTFLIYLINAIKFVENYFNSIKNLIYNSFSWLSRTTVDALNSAYNFKVAEKKANKIVAYFITAAFLFLFITVGIKVKTIIYDKNPKVYLEAKKEVVKKEKKIVSKKIPEKKKDTKVLANKKSKKTEEKKKIAKAPENKKQKPNRVKEFVLPNLNLRTDTVLSLFEDVKYDLKTVRYEKRVKPIYFTQFPKDLDEISSVQLKKETFIKIVLPLVVAENQKILDDKYKLAKIVSRKITTDKDKAWLRQKLKEYKVKNGNIKELKQRMDIIPISIALAQAAKESGWGTSRFALEGNAIFGQWTWKGSGIAPLERDEKLNHKILRFPILRSSVKAYKNNLNTHKSYKSFREKREILRKNNKTLDGLKLIHTLNNYAQTGKEYTKVLEKIVTQNSLMDFENVKLTNTVVKRELNL